MDLNKEYAAHQRALMRASAAVSSVMRANELALASSIAQRIYKFQCGLGAGGACVWSLTKV